MNIHLYICILKGFFLLHFGIFWPKQKIIWQHTFLVANYD